MISPDHSLWLLPFLLYAETHYRFKYFFSLLKKSEPEVIADIPHRIEPGQPLPILVLAKDADSYPCLMKQITIEMRQDQTLVKRVELLEKPITLNQKLFSQVFAIERSHVSGWVDVDVAFTLEVGSASSKYHNDNHRTSSHRPLRVFFSPHALPRFPGLHLGDPHTHSSYTDDQVEFGSPLQPTRDLARALGLSFFCVTDHSYDLDDRIDTYLVNDSSLPKWVSFQREVDSLNVLSDNFAIVRGEEVSCRNERGRNVHFLILGQQEFIPGSGDSAERWLRTKSEHTVGEVLRRKSEHALGFAAHAGEPVPLLQQLLLGRGTWSSSDLQREGLAGVQIINGSDDIGFERSYGMWIRLLLSGSKLCAIAGTDAHGNFNRSRQIGIPFFKINEKDHQIFGKWRTGIFRQHALSEKEILLALSQRHAIMTDGPVARMTAFAPDGHTAEIGDTITGPSIRLSVDVLSSEEFGRIEEVRVIIGELNGKMERTAYRFEGDSGYDIHKELAHEEARDIYVRLEATTSASGSCDGKRHFCLTNPVWVDAPS